MSGQLHRRQRRAQARALLEQVQANPDVPAPYRYQAQVRAQLPGELAPAIEETLSALEAYWDRQVV